MHKTKVLDKILKKLYSKTMRKTNMKYDSHKLHDILSVITTYIYKGVHNELVMKMLFNVSDIAEKSYIKSCSMFDLYSYLTTIALQTNENEVSEDEELCIHALEAMRFIEEEWQKSSERRKKNG